MPRRTADQGVRPFEVRVGVGAPRLGGIWRAGDPAMTPIHKQHMAVNIRITPSGVTNRPGLATQLDTGVAECIDGLIGPPGGSEPEPLVGLVVYPAGRDGFDETGGFGSDFAHPDALRPQTPSTFALIQEDADTAAGEEGYNAIPCASPSASNETAYVWKEPFLWKGKIHEFRTVTRTTPSGDVTEWALIEYVLPRKIGDTGTSKVVMYVGSTYDSETIEYCGGRCYTTRWETGGAWDDYCESVAGSPVSVFQRNDDQQSGAVRLVEVLYFWIRGNATKMHLMRYDGATMTEVGDFSGFWTYSASLCPSNRGGVWVMPNYRTALPASFYHIEPTGTITVLDHEDIELGYSSNERICIGFAQSGGYDYFLFVGYGGGYDYSTGEILRVDTAFTWDIRVAHQDINKTDPYLVYRVWNGRAFCAVPGGGVAVLSGAYFPGLQPGPEFYDFIYVDNPATTGFVVGIGGDDPTTLFSSANWSQLKSIVTEYYPLYGYGYYYSGAIWMIALDNALVLGGVWYFKDPLTGTDVTTDAPGHAIYKMLPTTYDLDVVYEDRVPVNVMAEPFYPLADAAWSMPSLGALLTATGQDDDEISTSLLGGA